MSAVLLVTSVANITKRETTTNIQKRGMEEMNSSFVAISKASPVDEKADAIENPAPKRKIISDQRLKQCYS
mgnify:CR=1 FL=1